MTRRGLWLIGTALLAPPALAQEAASPGPAPGPVPGPAAPPRRPARLRATGAGKPPVLAGKEPAPAEGGDKGAPAAQARPRPAATAGPAKGPDGGPVPAIAPAQRAATPREGWTAPRLDGVTTTPRPDLAPIPNRSLDRVDPLAEDDRPRLEPSVIRQRIPGRGQAAEGNPSIEDRAFSPAPGARLIAPFRY